MLEAALLILGAYLWGSVPSTYVAARYLRGIDIREFGSGNVGSANFMAHVGRRTGFLLGTSDCLVKGTLPVVVAKLLDQSLGVQAGVGLAAIAGHNWSPYIRFTGGRGVATAIGVVLRICDDLGVFCPDRRDGTNRPSHFSTNQASGPSSRY